MTTTLSKRQTQIVRLIAKGETDKGIAEKLGISRHTVDSHKRVIFLKLGVQCRALVAVRFVTATA